MNDLAVLQAIFGHKTVTMAVFEPLSLYDIRPLLRAMITEIAMRVSQCQSFVWDSRKSGSVFRA